jgi:Type IV secretion-system coupling protein DNA-binding domain
MTNEGVTYRIQFPTELAVDAVTGALLSLAGLSRPGRKLVHRFDVTARPGDVVHRLYLAKAVNQMGARQLVAAVPGLVLMPGPAAEPPTFAWRLWASTSRRSLSGPAEHAARTLLVALTGSLGRDESVSLHWLLGPVRRPRSVGSRHTAVLSESWPRALITAAVRPPGDLDPEARRALRDKLALPGWRAVGYIGVTATDRDRARQLARPILAALRTADGPSSHLGVRRSRGSAVTSTPWRWGLQLNISELPGLLAWPIANSGAGLAISQRAARLLPPPRGLSRSGRLLGRSPLTQRDVYLSRPGSMQHLHVLGPTGTGKSTLLVHLMLQDIVSGASVVALDPKGQLVDEVLARFPESRRDDLVVIDPTDPAPVGLNPLAAPADAELIADQLLSIFAKLYADSFGPRTSDVLHAALLTLVRTPGTSLATLPLLLTHDGYRRRLVGRLDDPLGTGPFWTWYESRSDAERQQIIAPTMNKVRPFLLRPALRAVIGQSAPRFDLRDIFTKPRVVLVNLAKGTLGPGGSALLGTLLLNQLWQTTLTRSSLPADQLRPVYLYVDEVQDFLRLPADIGDLLAQARSLKLAFTLAHQHLGQLTPDLQTAVLTNARSRVLFQLSSADAAVLSRGQSLLTPNDLTGLPAFETYCRLVAGQATTPYFSAVMLPPSPPVSEPSDLRRSSRERYGVPAAQTEAALRELVTGGPAPRSSGDIGRRPRRST